MTRLFDVPDGRRVRIMSKQIRYADTDDEGNLITIKLMLEDVTWTGTTTEHKWTYEGVERRLIVDHTIPCEKLESGIWQRDVECYVIG